MRWHHKENCWSFDPVGIFFAKQICPNTSLQKHMLVGGLEHFLNFPINIGFLIIPIDFNIFQRGSNHQPECHFVCSLDMLYYKIYCCAAGCAKSPCHGAAPKHVVWLYVNIGNQWSVLIFPVKLRFFSFRGISHAETRLQVANCLLDRPRRTRPLSMLSNTRASTTGAMLASDASEEEMSPLNFAFFFLVDCGFNWRLEAVWLSLDVLPT